MSNRDELNLMIGALADDGVLQLNVKDAPPALHVTIELSHLAASHVDIVR